MPTIQEQAPLSAFPPTVISVPKITAPNSTTLQYIVQYNEALAEGDFDECSAILAAHPEIDNCRISTTKFNTIIDEIKATQLLFNQDVQTYIASYVHIDDTATTATDRAYSCNKVNQLVDGVQDSVDDLQDAIENIEYIDIAATDWVGSGPYTATKSVSGLSSTSTPIPLLDRSIAASAAEEKNMVKNFSRISYYDTANGSITFTAKYNKPDIINMRLQLKGI